ncbi:MAG: class III poly(R)-hydroxyalkanoic acid synthase subunit PhaE [Lysobacteraceae bacterium]
MNFSNAWPQDFEALSRQYMNAWSEMARQAGSGHTQQVPGWQDAMDMWAPWARDGRAQTDDMLARMNTQTGAWFGNMQEVAKQFSGGQSSASDVASAWKRALGMENNGLGNPFAGMFQQMSGQGANSMDQWMQQIAPWLEGMRSESRNLFNMPAFGLQREQQVRWQGLAKSQMEYQQAMSGYNAQLMECGKRAFAKFEDKLAERSEPGRQIDSTRGLFDVWIDAAEESWAEVAMTPEFRSAYGALVNAQSSVRAGVNGEIERATAKLGMPTRTEVNSSHKKVTQLERDLRALKQQFADLEALVGEQTKAAAHAASQLKTERAHAEQARAEAKHAHAEQVRAEAKLAEHKLAQQKLAEQKHAEAQPKPAAAKATQPKAASMPSKPAPNKPATTKSAPASRRAKK